MNETITKEELRVYRLGNFEVESGKLIISDPGYEKGAWCSASVNASNGEWTAWSVHFAEQYEDNRYFLPIGLVATSSKRSLSRINFNQLLDADIGVDSGQAGIYDSDHFKDDSDVPEDFELPYEWMKHNWYALNSTKALADPVNADVIPYGAVSKSGHGDGLYYVAAKLNSKGEAVAVGIVFQTLELAQYDSLRTARYFMEKIRVHEANQVETGHEWHIAVPDKPDVRIYSYGNTQAEALQFIEERAWGHTAAGLIERVDPVQYLHLMETVSEDTPLLEISGKYGPVSIAYLKTPRPFKMPEEEVS